MRPCCRFASLLLLFACAAVLPAQQPGTPQPPAKPKAQPNGRITGHVLCGDTRRPARGAFVLLQSLSAKQDDSDAGSTHAMARVAMDGTYELDHIPAGSYAVVALLPGYLSPLDGLNASGINSDSDPMIRKALAGYNSVTVGNNGTAMDNLVLDRGAAVSGRVLYPDGSPASQVNILLENVAQKPEEKSSRATVNVGSMMRTMFTHQSTATDDQGNFRVSGITPGTYRLSATPVPQEMEGGDGMLMGMMNIPGLMHVYVGDTLHRKDAKVFELRGGDEIADLQITLPINSFHLVGGRLTAKDGRALSLATLTLTDTADSTLVFSGSLGENGIFRFPSVPAGAYLLTASDGRITTPNLNMPASMAVRMGSPISAFAEGSASVLVKDSDVTDVALALEETALKPVPKPTGVDEP